MPQHLKRLIAIFAVFIVLFLILHKILKPVSFGELGHYRALAIAENAAKTPRYAGAANCSACHDSIRTVKAEGLHAQLKCEICHGPGLKHAMYAGRFTNTPLPDSLILQKPRDRKYCLICHQINAARIKILFDTIDNTQIKQIDSLKHYYYSKKLKKVNQCILCHYPHQP